MKKRILLLAVLALMLLPTGCEAADLEILREIALLWAAEHAVDIGKYTLIGRSGNDEVDAVMDARGVVTNITAADQLMEEGRAQNDLSKMEQAIEKRPGDYTYRVSYGTALLQEGRADEAEDQFAAANDAAAEYGGDHMQQYAIQGIDELGAMRPGFEKNGFASVGQCQAYYGQLAHLYRIRHSGTQQAFFQDQANHYEGLKQGCQ